MPEGLTTWQNMDLAVQPEYDFLSISLINRRKLQHGSIFLQKESQLVIALQ